MAVIRCFVALLFASWPLPAGAWGQPQAIAPSACLYIYGFNFPTWEKDAYSKPETFQSLENAAASGAKWVAVVPTWYMRSKHSSSLEITDQTASDESIREIIHRAKSLDMHIVLKPHVNTLSQTPRALIAPDDPRAWFESYRGFIHHYAAMAQEENVEVLIIGTELYSMTAGARYKQNWETLIREVRSIYFGQVSYAANWFDFYRVPFWGALDFIGVNAYFPLLGGRHERPLELSWTPYLPILRHVAKRYRKPIVFTEIGVASRKGANKKPWNYKDKGPTDLKSQVAYFRAFLKEFQGKSYFRGFLVWVWEADPTAGGPADNHMTVQGKPALEILKKLFESLQADPISLPKLNLKPAADRAASVLKETEFFGLTPR